jgi:hypothetical protein
MCRIVFSIVFSRQWSPALLVFKLTKSRQNFYLQIERRRFHTTKTQSGGRVGQRSAAGLWAAGVVAVIG